MGCFAGVAELVDAGPSKGPGLTALWVRVPPPVPAFVPGRIVRAPAASKDGDRSQGLLACSRGQLEISRMCEWIRRVGLIALVGFVMPLALADVAQAQYREFSGRIDQINRKKMIVDNRMGDKVSFVPGSPSEVSGQGKTEWKKLKKNDWVMVSWKMIDKPRIAYRVKVLPPKEEAGEDD